jgi:hypothetical protein
LFQFAFANFLFFSQSINQSIKSIHSHEQINQSMTNDDEKNQSVNQQNTNQIKLARGQSQSIQSFLIHLNQFNVTINQSNQNQMKRIHSFFH